MSKSESYDWIHDLVDRFDLDPEDAEEVARALLQGEFTPVQSAALLTSLRIKGETVWEVAAFARAMRSSVIPVFTSRTPLLDTCGTGGSTFKTFNVSTCAALLLASQEVAVAKHGNRAMSGTCGSADVLEALGVNLALTPAQVGKVIDRVGIGFLFAQSHHPGMKHIAPVRRELGFRTIFNLMGPLSNPAGATLQLMGVYEKRLCALAAGALKELGCERAFVVHHAQGADEILTFGTTYCSELRDGVILERLLTAADFGLKDWQLPDPNHLRAVNTLSESAEVVERVLSGFEKLPQDTARLDLVSVNAGAAFTLTGHATTLAEGYDMARAALKSGAGRDKLAELVLATNEMDDPLSTAETT